MISERSPERLAIRFQLIEELRKRFLIEFGGADIVANMLSIRSDDELNSAELSYINVLGEILELATLLSGSIDRGINWLIHSPGYKRVVGNDAYYCLEHGSFWSMCVMRDWLIINHQFPSADIQEEVFGKLFAIGMPDLF